MAQQIGLIRENQKDGYAVVITDRKGACSGCHTGGDGCRSCLSGAKLESRVANPINAREGDVVKITLKSSELFKGAASSLPASGGMLHRRGFHGRLACQMGSMARNHGVCTGGTGRFGSWHRPCDADWS